MTGRGNSDSHRRLDDWVGSPWATAAVMNLIIVAVVITAFQYGFGWDWQAWLDNLEPLKLLGIWAFSFLPGWLFIRFLGQRAAAVWLEFVLHLHRLGVDEPQYLPEPPRTSEYHARWQAGGGTELPKATIYQEKFDAYFGKSVSKIGVEHNRPVRAETLFPVFLSTAVFAAAWTAVLWNTSFVINPSGPADMLKFGFIGAYSFIAQMLMRRFFQNDLKASAYVNAVLRVFVVVILIAVLHQIPALRGRPNVEAVVAFVIGFFPLVGMQALQRMTAGALRVFVPSLNPAYPLNEIDGLNVWYEARLLEEGIEDMQNLATANLVDVILHTHVPVGRLIDWVDQAHLFQHLDRTERTFVERLRARGITPSTRRTRRQNLASAGSSVGDKEQPATKPSREGGGSFREGSRMRHALRRLGIRTATDLLKVASSESDTEFLVNRLSAYGLDGEVIRTLPRILSQEPGLNSVWNWQAGAPQSRGQVRRERDARLQQPSSAPASRSSSDGLDTRTPP